MQKDWAPGLKCHINVDVLEERQKKMAFHIVFNEVNIGNDWVLKFVLCGKLNIRPGKEILRSMGSGYSNYKIKNNQELKD